MDGLVGLFFAFSVVAAMLTRIVFFSALRRRIPELSVHNSGVPLYLEWVYLRHRKTLGSTKLDRLALAAIGSGVLAILSTVVLNEFLSTRGG